MFSGITENEGQLANTRRDLIVGVYTEKLCAKFINRAGDIAIYYRMYYRDGDAQPTVIDVIAVSVVEDLVYFCDYMKLESGEWRCSDGRISVDFAGLTPPESEGFYLQFEYTNGDVIEVTRGTP